MKTSPSKRRHSTIRKSDSAAAQPAEQSGSQNQNQQLVGQDENQQPVAKDVKSSAGKEDAGQDNGKNCKFNCIQSFRHVPACQCVGMFYSQLVVVFERVWKISSH